MLNQHKKVHLVKFKNLCLKNKFETLIPPLLKELLKKSFLQIKQQKKRKFQEITQRILRHIEGFFVVIRYLLRKVKKIR